MRPEKPWCDTSGVLSPDDSRTLRARLGEASFARRLEHQAKSEIPLFGRSSLMVPIKYVVKVQRSFGWLIRGFGLYPRGQRNALNISAREHKVPVHGLPAPFIGYRILHLSDLHLTPDHRLADAIIRAIEGLSYDLVCITGDFCEDAPIDTYWQAVAQARRVIRSLRPPVLGVLGNHDLIEFAPTFEQLGVTLLLNEHTWVERHGVRLYVAGVDDPHYYANADLGRALRGIPPDAFTVLLAHSAEIYHDAAEAGIPLMLCGHSHGGQICLPGGIPFFYSSKAPRSMVYGLWEYGPLTGYTSPGLGTSLIPVRFSCPPEAIVHVLDRA